MAAHFLLRKARPIYHGHLKPARGHLFSEVIAKDPQMIVLPKRLLTLLLRRQRRILICREPAFFLRNREDGKAFGGEHAMYLGDRVVVIGDVFQHVACDQHVDTPRRNARHRGDVELQVNTFV